MDDSENIAFFFLFLNLFSINLVSSDEFNFFEFVFDRMRILSPGSETEFRPNSNLNQIRLSNLIEFTQIYPII
jgi:hypothetical protein